MGWFQASLISSSCLLQFIKEHAMLGAWLHDSAFNPSKPRDTYNMLKQLSNACAEMFTEFLWGSCSFPRKPSVINLFLLSPAETTSDLVFRL